MFNQLKELFQLGVGDPDRGGDTVDLKLAVAALLVEAAVMDETFDDAERAAISRVLQARFALADTEAQELIAAAEERMSQTEQYHPFAQRVNEELDISGRAQIIEMMWTVALADGELDPHEDMLLRQVAGLLHVPDRDRGLARRRAQDKLNAEN